MLVPSTMPSSSLRGKKYRGGNYYLLLLPSVAVVVVVASVGAVRLAIKRLTKNKHKFKSPNAKPVEVDSLLREVLLERFDQYLIHQKLLFNINNL